MSFALRHRFVLMFACLCAAWLAFPIVASADNVVTNVGAGATVSVASGGTVTVGYAIQARNKDGEVRCNATANSPAVLTIAHPPAVDVRPATLIFKKCNTSQPVVFSSSTEGNYAIQVTVADDGPGTYIETAASFTLHVLPPPDREAPLVTINFPSPPLASAPWFVSMPVTGTVTASDGQNVTTVTCTNATVANEVGLGSRDYSADLIVTSEGSSFVTCQAGDSLGHFGAAPGSANSAVVQIDSVGPVITAQPDRDPDSNDWYNRPLSVSFTGEDSASGVESCDVPRSYSGPDNEHAIISVTCADVAGNVGRGDFSF